MNYQSVLAGLLRCFLTELPEAIFDLENRSALVFLNVEA
jgi:hypothetical protein